MPIIVACPACGGQLRVSDDLVGRKVRCPACDGTFTAAQSPPPEAPASAGEPAPWRNLDLERAGDSPGKKDSGPAPKGAVEINLSLDDSGAHPRSPSAPESAPESPPQLEREERTPRRDEEDRPPWRTGRDLDEEEDEDYPRRRRQRVRRDCDPHRGGLILTFGILSIVPIFVGCWPAAPIMLGFGIAAWWMGGSDRHKIRAGTMDPDGEGTTQAGWICGIVGIVLSVLVMLGCGGFFGFMWYDEMQRAKQQNRQNFPAPPRAIPAPPMVPPPQDMPAPPAPVRPKKR